MPIDAISFGRITAPDLSAAAGSSAEGAQGQFADLLRQGIARLEQLDEAAAEQTEALLAGEPVDLHRVVLANEQAGLAFDLLMSIRNKAVEAYQEIMRMQV